MAQPRFALQPVATSSPAPGESDLLAEIERLGAGDAWFDDQAARLQSILGTTSSARARAGAAMALADHRVTAATVTLLDILARPEMAETAGTLLFSLNELGGTLPLSVLVTIIEHGSFEARAEALTFGEEGRLSVPANETLRLQAEDALARLAAAQDERAEAAALALSYLAEAA